MSGEAREVQARKGRIVIPSPEGVPLEFRLGSIGDRAVAFLLDNLIIGLLVLVLVLGAATQPGMAVWAIVVFGFFLLRHFYFAVAESRGRGRTPGKRVRGLRVVDAAGGALDARSLVVRNLLRELDTYLPLTVIPALPMLWPGAPGWIGLLTLVWVVGVMLVPVFDSRRRRLGDIVAGTLVLSLPRPVLLPDLADRGNAPEESGEHAGYSFTEEQLASYGIYELQVLEPVLRQEDLHSAMQSRATVSETIRAKIGWTDDVESDRRFLTAFYKALRADLERRMLFGERREDKRAAEATRKPSRDR